MRNILLITLLFTQLVSHAQWDSLSYKLLNKKSEVVIKPNSRISIKAKPFSLEFVVPKDAETIINLQSSLDSTVYYKYFECDSISELTAWKTGNAMAVFINAFTELSTSLNLENDARQPYDHDGMSFTSFNQIDSLGNWLNLKLDFKTFTDVEGVYYEKGKAQSFKKAKKRNIFLLMEVLIIPEEGEEYREVIPFILAIR